LSLKSKKRVDFNTGCAVFAESEAISRLSQEVTKEDLLAGIHRALAAQINSLVERLGVEQDLAVVGGGARDAGLVLAVREGQQIRYSLDTTVLEDVLAHLMELSGRRGPRPRKRG